MNIRFNEKINARDVQELKQQYLSRLTSGFERELDYRGQSGIFAINGVDDSGTASLNHRRQLAVLQGTFEEVLHAAVQLPSFKPYKPFSGANIVRVAFAPASTLKMPVPLDDSIPVPF